MKLNVILIIEYEYGLVAVELTAVITRMNFSAYHKISYQTFHGGNSINLLGAKKKILYISMNCIYNIIRSVCCCASASPLNICYVLYPWMVVDVNRTMLHRN